MGWYEIVTLTVVTVGAVGSVTAVVLALQANLLVKESGQETQRLRELAAGNAAVADQTKGLLVDTNETVEGIKDVVLRSEARDTERRDVRWEGHWVAPGCYVLTNVGQDEAVSAHAWLSADGQKVEASADDVLPGGGIELTVFGLADEVTRRRQELARRMPGGFRVYSPLDGVAVVERVSWCSPLGQHSVYESKPILYSFDDLW